MLPAVRRVEAERGTDSSRTDQGNPAVGAPSDPSAMAYPGARAALHPGRPGGHGGGQGGGEDPWAPGVHLAHADEEAGSRAPVVEVSAHARNAATARNTAQSRAMTSNSSLLLDIREVILS